MPKLNPLSQKILKIVHLIFVCLWIGGATTVPAMKIGLHPSDGHLLYGFDLTRKFVDDYIIIPGAVGCLLTGLCYSMFTGFGFFKLRWVTVKWVITMFGVIYGTFWLGPWLNSLPPISLQLGMDALHNPEYQRAAIMNFSWGLFQLATLIFAAAISVLKPWKSNKS